MNAGIDHGLAAKYIVGYSLEVTGSGPLVAVFLSLLFPYHL